MQQGCKCYPRSQEHKLYCQRSNMITAGFSLTSWINIELEDSILALCLNRRAMQVSTTPTFGWVEPGMSDLPLESLFYVCGWKKINSNGLIIYANVEEQTKMIFSHIQCFCQQFLWIIKLPVSRKKRYTLPDKMIRMVQASIWQDMFINNKNWGSLSQNSNLNEKADKFSSWQSNYRITI